VSIDHILAVQSKETDNIKFGNLFNYLIEDIALK